MENNINESYICPECGATLKTCKWWGPRCKKAGTGARVCAECCSKCEYHKKWSGLWRCSFVTEEEKREAVLRRIRDRGNAENRMISEIYTRRRKEKAQEYAIKMAKKRAKAKRKSMRDKHAALAPHKFKNQEMEEIWKSQEKSP